MATGVEFGKADGSGSRQVAYARKEVILAAGAINVSPMQPFRIVSQKLTDFAVTRRPLLSCSFPELATRAC